MSETTMTNIDTPPPPPPPPAAFPVPQPYPSYPQRKNPAAAGLLSVIPGGGHLYLGLYQRGVTFFVVWVMLIAIAGRADVIGWAIPFWMLFVLIDAVRQAKHMNATGAPESNVVGDEVPLKGGSLFLGVLMILFGGFFLLERYIRIDLSVLLDQWPILLVLFGAWQIFTYYKEKQKATAAADPTTSDEL